MSNILETLCCGGSAAELEACASLSEQVGGDHYSRLAIQPWDAMEAWLTAEEYRGYLKGCAIKYLARKKNDESEDIAKAIHYLQKLLEVSKCC